MSRSRSRSHKTVVQVLTIAAVAAGTPVLLGAATAGPPARG